ncbi:NUMOD1 domain-containing DNA-binding protein [Vibrio alginolyticus]|uniref:NUMOD1 domain-containing DNA-binding protein n=1 Tax=Vibrio alginolyticus TaxID=663 RepID=UPI0006CA6CC6|nr:NUMOD1 domain-containing DNA-binding protein [Vibrio alginolyticus]KPM98627.1 hypothetical protein AOG25_09335 [Vibrio alginolyticus]
MSKSTTLVIFDSTGKKVTEFENPTQVAKHLNAKRSNVSRAVNNPEDGHKVSGHYIRLKSDVKDEEQLDLSTLGTPIYSSYDINGRLLKVFDSAKEMSDKYKLTPNRMRHYTNSGEPYIYEDGRVFLFAQGGAKRIETIPFYDKQLTTYLLLKDSKYVDSFITTKDVADNLSVTNALVARAVKNGTLIKKMYRVYKLQVPLRKIA